MVSILIPAYNCAAFVGAAIESALAQTYPNVELLVIDDGSTDGTADAVQPYTDRVTFRRQENAGTGGARNAALRLASGEFVALLDADDLWLPHKIESQMRVFEIEPKADIGFTRLRYMREDGTPGEEPEVPWTKHALREPAAVHPQVLNITGNVLLGLVEGNYLPQGTLAARTVAIRAVGGYDESLRHGEDYDLALRMAAAGANFAFLDEVTYVYRQFRLPTVRSRVAHVRDRIRIMEKLTGSAESPGPAVVAAARRRIRGLSKLCGDLLVCDGQMRAARRMYSAALKGRPRPMQLASWLLTWSGPLGAGLIRLLNSGSHAFRQGTDRPAGFRPMARHPAGSGGKG